MFLWENRLTDKYERNRQLLETVMNQLGYATIRKVKYKKDHAIYLVEGLRTDEKLTSIEGEFQWNPQLGMILIVSKPKKLYNLSPEDWELTKNLEGDGPYSTSYTLNSGPYMIKIEEERTSELDAILKI